MSDDGCVHFSRLKLMARSPAHYRAGFGESTRTMNFGTLVHALVLGGDVVVFTGKRRQGKDWDAFGSAHQGRFIVTQPEYDRAAQCADAIRSNELAAPLLVGKTELAWRAEMFGRPCAGRFDVAGADFTSDLKITNDTTPERFARQCLKMAYHAQARWYQDARVAMGEPRLPFYMIGAEPKAPFAVTVLRVTERALDEGHKLNTLWMNRLAACEESNEWPAYLQTTGELDVVQDAEIEFDIEEVG